MSYYDAPNIPFGLPSKFNANDFINPPKDNTTNLDNRYLKKISNDITPFNLTCNKLTSNELESDLLTITGNSTFLSNINVSSIATINNLNVSENATFNNIASNNLSVNSSLNITGLTNFRNNLFMNDKTILLRSTNQHGLKMAGGGASTFSGIDVDGPILFGNGVCLGTGQGQGSDRAYLLIKNNNTSIMSNLNISGNANFNNDVIINNNLTVRGTTTTIDSTNVNIADNILLLNSNFTTGSLLSSFQSGLEVRRGSQLPYRFVFSEADDSFKIGVFNTSISDLQSVATRQDTPTINGLTFWNTQQSRLDTSSNFVVSGNSIFLSNLNVNSNLNVSGNTTLNNPSTFVSTLMISGNTTINSDLTLSINKFTGGFGVNCIDNSGNVRPYNCPLYTRGFQAGIGLNYETFNESTTASFLRSGIQIISTNPETTWRTILETDAWGDNNRGSNIWFYTYNSANSANTRLGMTERLRITNNTTATSLTAGTVQITGGLAISDDIFCSSLNVLSAGSINSSLTISGFTNINSSLNVVDNTVLNTAVINGSMTINSNILLNDRTICMRSNTNSGLRMCGNGTNTMPMRFSNFNANGPVLYGAQGGILGTNEGGTERISLQWGTIDMNISNITQFRNNVFLNDKILYLRSEDTNHGLRMCGNGTNTSPLTFANFNANGPVLYGLQGGVLGSVEGGTERIALQWGTNEINISTNTQFRNNVFLNDKMLNLRSDTNINGLRMCGDGINTSTTPLRFANFNANGPVLCGEQGGILGTVEGGTERISLQWGTIDMNISNTTQFRNNVFLNDKTLNLRSDTNHGLRLCGSSNQFAGVGIDGPALYGFSGGILGTTTGAQKSVLQWNNNNVSINSDLFVSGRIRGYTAGQVLNVVFYTFPTSTDVTISSTSYTDIASYSYTPISNSSTIIVDFNHVYEIAGFGDDVYKSRIIAIQSSSTTELSTQRQFFKNNGGGGCRSACLFPLMGSFTNSSPNSISFRSQALLDGANDNISIKMTFANSNQIRITEIAR